MCRRETLPSRKPQKQAANGRLAKMWEERGGKRCFDNLHMVRALTYKNQVNEETEPAPEQKTQPASYVQRMGERQQIFLFPLLWGTSSSPLSLVRIPTHSNYELEPGHFQQRLQFCQSFPLLFLLRVLGTCLHHAEKPAKERREN